MPDEEIKVRLGLDNTPFERELRRSQGSARSFGEESHRSFVHAGNGAREFHKSLHGIAEQSPIMGNLLRLAISPIGGFFAIATAGATYFHEKLKALNEFFDKFGAFASKPIVNIAKNLRDARRAAEEFNEDFQKWTKERGEHETDKITNALAEQLDLLKQQNAEAEKLAKQGGGVSTDQLKHRQLEVEFKLQAQALMQVSEKNMGALDKVKASKESYESRLTKPTIGNANNAIKVEEEFQQLTEERLKAAKAAVTDTSDILLEAIKSATHQGDFSKSGGASAQQRVQAVRDLETALEASKKRVEANNESIEKETLARKRLKDELEEAKSNSTRTKTAFDTLSKSLEATRVSLNIAGGEVTRPTQTGIEAYNARIKQKMDDYNTSVADRMNRWNREHGLPYYERPNKITPESQMKSMDQLIDKFTKAFDKGFPVIGIDDGGGPRK